MRANPFTSISRGAWGGNVRVNADRGDRPYKFVTNCVGVPPEDVQALTDMIDNGRAITYQTFVRHVDLGDLPEQMGYERNARSGLTLASDWAVSYYKGTYKGRPCYYMEHSRIEYIFQIPERG